MGGEGVRDGRVGSREGSTKNGVSDNNTAISVIR